MPRRPELDWVRAVSMAAVLLIHASAGYIARPSRLTLLGVTPAFFCNQAARFSVPMFFLLSGLSLGFSTRPACLPDFWLRRLRRVGLPYLCWTLFYSLAAHRTSLETVPVPAFLHLLGRELLLGGAAAHLWFIPPLLEFYLLFPLLRRFFARFPRWTLGGCFLLTLCSTLIICIPLPFSGWWRPHLWRMFPTWILYFVLGMALSSGHWDRLTALCEKHAPLLLPLGLAAAFFYSLDGQMSGDTSAVKPQLFLYTPLVLAALLAARRYLRPLPAVEMAVSFAAKHSLTVYFIHVFLLSRLRRFSVFQANALGMLGLFASDLLLSSAAAAALDAVPRLLRARKKS